MFIYGSRQNRILINVTEKDHLLHPHHQTPTVSVILKPLSEPQWVKYDFLQKIRTT